ncbi:MAG TPA: PQQ-dependent sugar dehydrogenase [Hyphomicrobiaceae bacterium]|nr:PQQ-dependent sugar dehydrogenase [Hyphomicrobiaceae bacterium]
MKIGLIAALLLAILATPAALGKEAKRQRLAAAASDLVSRDQALGKSQTVRAEDLPAPGATRSVSNPPLIRPFRGQRPKLPEGFTATLYAKLKHPRRLLVLPNGDVVVAEQDPGILTLLRGGGDGKAEAIERYAQGFNQPYGLAWRDGEILVADQDGIWKLPQPLDHARSGEGEQEGAADPRQGARHSKGQALLTSKGVFGAARGHANRPLAIEPGTGALFVGVGSVGNIGVEPPVKATIQRFAPDGSGQTTFASGLRNPCGLAINPSNGELWAVVQERDGLGDRLVPDYMVQPKAGAFYGWPYAYTGQHPQPGFASQAPEKVQASKLPDLLFEAHSAAMDLVFYNGAQFPADYRGSAFVVLKGSWNRSAPTGYKVVRVPFRDGRPVGSYENFMTGFWVAGRQRAEVWGRPAAIALAKDGALLVADDAAGTIWRVAYTGPQRKVEGPAN